MAAKGADQGCIAIAAAGADVAAVDDLYRSQSHHHAPVTACGLPTAAIGLDISAVDYRSLERLHIEHHGTAMSEAGCQ